MGNMTKKAQEILPRISKNTILRDKVNDEQVALAKQGPMMVRNPKKIAKEGQKRMSFLGD